MERVYQHETIYRQRGARSPRRGVALVLVMTVLALVTIITYSALASAALQVQASAQHRTASQAHTLAESGVELAMQYLLHPSQSPVPLVLGASGDYHYPGQMNVLLGDQAFDITVTNPRIGTYVIHATGRATDEAGNVMSRRLRVRVVGFGTWKPRAAAQFRNDVQLDPNVIINGGLLSDGSYLGGGVVSGVRRAINYLLHTSDPAWQAPLQPPEQAAPRFESLSLVRSVYENGGKYLYNGQLCTVDYIAISSITTAPTPSAGNPGRVFVYLGAAPLVLTGSGHQHFQGTLVITQADLEIQSRWCVIPEVGMPGVLLAKGLKLSTPVSQLRVDNLLYCGTSVSGPGRADDKALQINGVLMSAGPAGSVFASGVQGPVELNLDYRRATIPDLTAQGIRYERLQIESWEQVN